VVRRALKSTMAGAGLIWRHPSTNTAHLRMAGPELIPKVENPRDDAASTVALGMGRTSRAAASGWRMPYRAYYS
jgi:hypothetical protein